MVSLKNKVVVVTGASSGIGKAAAIEFARSGCRVVLAARRIDRLEELKRFITGFNENCIFVQTDVTSEDDIAGLFERAQQEFGAVDILVNNAGCGLRALVSETDRGDWERVVETNLTSVFLCSRQAVRTMRRLNTRGHIITVCSVAGLYGGPNYSAYCASKHGVAGFCRSLKWEVRRYGIKVSTLYPARVDTEFFVDYKQKPEKNQMLPAKDVAEYIVAVASRSFLKTAGVFARNVLKRAYLFLSG